MIKILNTLFIIIIKFYKYLISPLLGHRCRFLPTCSDYCIESVQTFGFVKGLRLSIKRILKCHPIKFLGSDSGLDLVPKKGDK